MNPKPVTILAENVTALKHSVAWLLKELRNDIVHEYVLNNLLDLFKEVYKQVPTMLKMVDSAITEADRVSRKASKG